MAGNNKVDKTEKEKRIYQVGLMLRRKSRPFILRYVRENWHLETAQADNYIKAARKEWQKYFEKLKGDGMSYHVAQLRDLKDQAYGRKVIVGKGKKKINEETGKTEMIYDNKQSITIADLGLVFDITKEEAKLMGIYPAEKRELTGAGGEPIRYIIEKTYEKPEKLTNEEIKESEKGKVEVEEEPKELKSGRFTGL